MYLVSLDRGTAGPGLEDLATRRADELGPAEKPRAGSPQSADFPAAATRNPLPQKLSFHNLSTCNGAKRGNDDGESVEPNKKPT